MDIAGAAEKQGREKKEVDNGATQASLEQCPVNW